MKKILVSGLKVCYGKCVPRSENDYLNSFQKNCVGKCAEKYVETYFKAQGSVIGALPD